MLQLPNVTLVCLTNQKLAEHDQAIVKSCESINFGGVKMIVDYRCDSIDEWNKKIIYELPDYIDTDFALLIHADGYIIHPELWNKDWLNYDYVGAPWPMPVDDHSYRDSGGNIVRVGNSVSLRSKRLMRMIAGRPEKEFWDIKEKFGNTNEDGFICCHNRTWLEAMGMKFAPLDVAKHFSKEHEIPENEGIETFAFHQVDK